LVDIERDARIQSLLREVNERIAGITLAWGAKLTVDVLCECGRNDCLGLIRVPVPIYAAVRREPRQFVVFPEHAEAAHDRVLDHYGDFVVVEALGKAGQIAEETHSRAAEPAGVGATLNGGAY
jgi:hypothetical protein